MISPKIFNKNDLKIRMLIRIMDNSRGFEHVETIARAVRIDFDTVYFLSAELEAEGMVELTRITTKNQSSSYYVKIKTKGRLLVRNGGYPTENFVRWVQKAVSEHVLEIVIGVVSAIVAALILHYYFEIG